MEKSNNNDNHFPSKAFKVAVRIMCNLKTIKKYPKDAIDVFFSTLLPFYKEQDEEEQKKKEF